MSGRRIPLGRKGGTYALVDKRDYDRISRFKWFDSGGHAHRTSRGTRIGLHSEVMRVDPKELIDHRNGDGLDNRRSNLRLATKSQNMMNKKLSPRNTSGFKGVSRSGKRWSASIGNNGTQVRLGSFETAQIAALAYDDAARKLYGEYARYNFPKKGELSVNDDSLQLRKSNYARKTISIPMDTMNQIEDYVSGYPGLTLSSFLTNAAISTMRNKRS